MHYYRELHNTASAQERGQAGRIPMRHYAHTFKARAQCMVNSYLQEFFEGVFSAEGSCRFFRTFMQRFVSDSNGKGDDSNRMTPALVPVAIIIRR